ncbi:MAG TPA: hypothetical protein VFK21_01755 [Gammaproteobacteria bacterium]|nr:hypothetical protein [Gammaproteobacteria bacterium]
MNKKHWPGVLLFMCLILAAQAGVAGDAGKKGYVTEIDFTEPSSYSINYITDIKLLRVLDKDIPHAGYIYGAYSEPFAFTGGTEMMVFPNGKFAVAQTCDVCPGPNVLFYGSWHEQGGVVSFSIEQRPPGRFADIMRKRFEAHYGGLGDYDLFVLAKGEGIGETILVPEATLTVAPVNRFFVRKVVYVDWEQDLSRIQKALSGHEGP